MRRKKREQEKIEMMRNRGEKIEKRREKRREKKKERNKSKERMKTPKDRKKK